MIKKEQFLFAWSLGGIIYYSFEMLFRGFSHWTMFVLGGICFAFLTWQGILVKWKDPLWLQVLRATIFITACEFITGIIVNKWMQWQVWDYSDQPLQLWGQICVPFMIIFSGLSAVGILLSGYLMHWLFGDEKPDFHVL